MDIEAKKEMLLAMIAATTEVWIINDLITAAWANEVAPAKAIVLKEGKPPKSKLIKEIKIHGQMYRSLRYACVKCWGMSEKEYQNTSKALKREGVVIEDLLAPRRDPDKIRLPTDKMGVVQC